MFLLTAWGILDNGRRDKFNDPARKLRANSAIHEQTPFKTVELEECSERTESITEECLNCNVLFALCLVTTVRRWQTSIFCAGSGDVHTIQAIIIMMMIIAGICIQFIAPQTKSVNFQAPFEPDRFTSYAYISTATDIRLIFCLFCYVNIRSHRPAILPVALVPKCLWPPRRILRLRRLNLSTSSVSGFTRICVTIFENCSTVAFVR